jgi:hypothetical protein
MDEFNHGVGSRVAKLVKHRGRTAGQFDA